MAVKLLFQSQKHILHCDPVQLSTATLQKNVSTINPIMIGNEAHFKVSFLSLSVPF